MFVIRKKLSATEGNAPGTRYNPDCNCFEVTPDGGTTWNPDPGADPRQNTALYLPPADSRCAAAAGMRLFVEDFIDNTYLTFSIVGISSAALAIGAVFLPGIGQLVALAWALGDFMLTVGEITLQLTFDDDLYDQLECIFYCNLDADGRLDQARFDQVGIDIQEIIADGNVNIVMAAMFNLYGFVGFTNAGVTYADDEADCDDCDCGWCYEFQFTVSPDGFTQLYGGYSAGQGYYTTYETPISHDMYGNLNFPAAATITEVSLRYTKTGGYGGNDVNRLILYSGATIVASAADNSKGTNLIKVIDLGSVGETADRVYVDINNGDDGGTTAYMLEIGLKGTGENPFGDSNC